ncbi:hypothetical protein [Actinokineospora sp. NBRC 105648]|uniref:hypothetical protein n=1 Tax=Actinokineospora sp. NBRC 105648 TaxID=3032206 RepID=UPI0024A5C784|nr:hypothetical protein [Actinokineospora sp. NBRC 105648]GLZ36573.1 hypothetical protein Acsp05_01980 [Actinokineospora sp. NBRC 105648]
MAALKSTSDSDPAVLVARRYARGATAAAVVIAGFWHVGFDLPATAGNWTVYTRQWAAATGWVLYLAIGVAGAFLLRREQPSRWAWPLAVAALGVDVLLVAAAPDEGLLRPANWAWGAVGWLAVILFWRHRLAHLVAFLVANTVLLGAAMALVGAVGRFELSRAMMVLLGAATLQLGYSLSAHGLGTAAGWAARSSAARARVTAERAAAEAVAAARAQRYRALHRSTAALLADLAAGADPADPEVRHRCATGAAQLRRLLAETDDVPDPLLHELRAGADIAERRGVLVSLSAVGEIPDLPVDTRRALTEAPIVALSQARTMARVTVVALADEVTVAVVADAPDVDVRAHPDIRLTRTREGDRLWLQAEWTGR